MSALVFARRFKMLVVPINSVVSPLPIITLLAVCPFDLSSIRGVKIGRNAKVSSNHLTDKESTQK